MQIVWAFALFASLAAAELTSAEIGSSSVAFQDAPSISTPGSATAVASASPSTPTVFTLTSRFTLLTSTTTSSIPALLSFAATPSVGVTSIRSSGVSKGPIVAAAVGGSIAACLVVFGGLLFCLRYRPRKTVVGVDGAADSSRRYEDLEGQVRALREQVERLEARQLAGAGGGAVLYTHEKDAEALEKDPAAKELPPTYVD
ncbi:hypothetical protein C8R44DRAFT_759994 [Mycena epipterygia]|nr:hypothetical protein C8R44DRAFT_759994 [Mycena epipterygia]